jgi:hypothetical protein
MTSLTPFEERPLKKLDGLPTPRAEERLEATAHELMAVSGMLRSAELREELCAVGTLERAKRAAGAIATVRTALKTACQPATIADLGEHIEALIKSIPQGEPADDYQRALVRDVGSLQPTRGALEAACRRLRTTAMFRPKIPEVLDAVREAGAVYAAALRVLDELPGQIARAEHSRQQAEQQAGPHDRVR